MVRLPSRLGYDRMIRVSVESGVEYTQSSQKFGDESCKRTGDEGK